MRRIGRSRRTVTGTGNLILNMLSGLAFGATGVTMVMLLIALILGCFIDPVAITMICVPIFIPVLHALGFDIFTFMMLFIMAVVTGYITPPFGLNLFVLKGVVPKYEITHIFAGTIPFLIPTCILIVLMILFPDLVLWLPNLLYSR